LDAASGAAESRALISKQGFNEFHNSLRVRDARTLPNARKWKCIGKLSQVNQSSGREPGFAWEPANR
jgi:hypothetical protein